MSHGMRNARDELHAMQVELNEAKLSRRGFLARLQALSLGFGAAFALGIKPADATVGVEGEVRLRSTDPALAGIMEEARAERAASGDAAFQLAQYGRAVGPIGRRGYTRTVVGPRYSRTVQQYARVSPYLQRYARAYGRR